MVIVDWQRLRQKEECEIACRDHGGEAKTESDLGLAELVYDTALLAGGAYVVLCLA